MPPISLLQNNRASPRQSTGEGLSHGRIAHSPATSPAAPQSIDDKGFLPTIAGLMDGPGNEFPFRAAFALDQHCRRTVRNQANHPKADSSTELTPTRSPNLRLSPFRAGTLSLPTGVAAGKPCAPFRPLMEQHEHRSHFAGRRHQRKRLMHAARSAVTGSYCRRPCALHASQTPTRSAGQAPHGSVI